MAFGKPPDKKGMKISPNVDDQLWRSAIASEENATAKWSVKWSWILMEYSKRKEQLDEATRTSILPKDKVIIREPEVRTGKPFPESVAHEIGWLSAKREFRLEKFGPDVDKGMPFRSMSE